MTLSFTTTIGDDQSQHEPVRRRGEGRCWVHDLAWSEPAVSETNMVCHQPPHEENGQSACFNSTFTAWSLEWTAAADVDPLMRSVAAIFSKQNFWLLERADHPMYLQLENPEAIC